MVHPGRPQMTMYYGAFASQAGYPRLQTHSEHVFIALPRQQWLRERLSMLRVLRTLSV